MIAGLRMLFIAGCLMLVTFSSAQALMLGNDIYYRYHQPTFADILFPNSANNGLVLVDSGVEISNVAYKKATMDISDTNIYIQFLTTGQWTDVKFNGWSLTDTTNSIDPFLSVTINSATNVAADDLDLLRISFDENMITMNWAGLNFDKSTIISLDINSERSALTEQVASPVPEPGTVFLLGVGLLALACYARRRGASVRITRH